ncbi:MAG: MFS transporter [Chloroflexi bacterium]|nr:MFS transporter [Chloroflexota bacterium]
MPVPLLQGIFLLPFTGIGQRARRLYYGWWIVVATFVIQFMNASLLFHSFGAYFEYLRTDLNASRAAISGAFSLARMEEGMLGPLQGWLVTRFGPKTVARVGVVLFGSGLMLFSRVDSVLLYYAVFLLMAVGTSMAGFVTLNSTLANWFIKRRTVAMSWAQMGLPVGGLTISVIAWSLSTYGWRPTAFASGIVAILVGFTMAGFLRRTPEAYGLLPDGAKPDSTQAGLEQSVARRSSAEEPQYTPFQAMRDRSFWLISIGHGMALFVVSVIIAHFIPHLKEDLGWSTVQATVPFTIIIASSIAAQSFMGFASDKFEKRYIAAGCMITHSIAMLIIASTSNLPLIYFAGILHGAAWGTRGPLMSSIRAEYFGRKHFAYIIGYSSIIVMVGAVVGPIFSGLMADNLGSYRPGFAILGVLTGIGSIAFFFARRPIKLPRARGA